MSVKTAGDAATPSRKNLAGQRPAPRVEKLEANPYPWYSPRFWHGMRPLVWWKLCAAHGFRFHPIRWPMAFLIGLVTPFNSVMGTVQRLRCGKDIEATEIEHPPVFIIGHWRSGTTYLHELMCLDERFVSPTTYQCFAPHHCLLTEWWMNALGSWLVPKQRPMDNMAAGWDRPQEDEFALLTLGAPTPYVRMAFPNDPPPFMEFLDMQGCKPEDLARFETAIVHFVKLLTYASENKRERIDPAAIYDVRYEDLTAHPLAEVQKMYEKLELGPFDIAREKIEAFVAAQKDYKPNKHKVDDGLKAKIRERWKTYFDKYGYF